MKFVLAGSDYSLFLFKVDKVYSDSENDDNVFIYSDKKEITSNSMITKLTKVCIDPDNVIMVLADSWTRRSLVKKGIIANNGMTCCGTIVKADDVGIDTELFMPEKDLKKRLLQFDSIEDAALYAVASEDNIKGDFGYYDED